MENDLARMIAPFAKRARHTLEASPPRARVAPLADLPRYMRFMPQAAITAHAQVKPVSLPLGDIRSYMNKPLPCPLDFIPWPLPGEIK